MAGYVTERMTARGRADAAVKQAKKYAEADAIKERKMAEYHDSWSGREAQRIENNYLDRQAKAAAKRNAESDIIKSNRMAENDTRKEYEKLAAESGIKPRKHLSIAEQQKRIAAMNDENAKNDAQKKLEATYAETYAKRHAQEQAKNNADREQRFRLEQEKNVRENLQQQQAEAKKREQQRLAEAKAQQEQQRRNEDRARAILAERQERQAKFAKEEREHQERIKQREQARIEAEKRDIERRYRERQEARAADEARRARIDAQNTSEYRRKKRFKKQPHN